MSLIARSILPAQAAMVAGFAIALRSRRMPLGVPGQWEWPRIAVGPSAFQVATGLAAILAYAGFVGAGYRALSRSDGPRKVMGWLLGLVLAAVVVQGVILEAAPEAYGLSRWIFALHSPGSSGYYTVARDQMGDTGRFLADYPAWIEGQDALHVGTHPPGLFLIARGLLGGMEAYPWLARWTCDLAPGSAHSAIRVFRDSLGLPRADAAALTMTGALTLLACSLTVVPIYALARSTLPPSASWASATAWPLVPSALMFQPTADTAFPLVSAAALALATRGGIAACVASGLLMALGMACTLAFLPVGLVVALVLISGPDRGWGRKLALLLATGFGFVAGTLAWWAITSANPFTTWWMNLRNHARFYVEYPRSYLAWVAENPVELAIGLGLPVTTWAVIGLRSPRSCPRVAWATAGVLALLTISGKNLSEVARLWLPLMPPLVVAAGSGFAKVAAGGWTLAGSIALVGLQALILEWSIQVIYPF